MENQIQPAQLDFEKEIAGLVALSPLLYDQAREQAAKALGVRLSTLDAEVEAKRPKVKKPEHENTADFLAEVDPWPHPVDGAAVLDGVVAELNRFMVLPRHGAEAVALWCVFAHTHDAADNSPILAVESADWRCGKSTLLSIVSHLVPKPLPASSISPAALYRSVEHYRPTLLVDEGDSFLRDNEDMRGVLNSGFSRTSAYVVRCDGDENQPRLFCTWCAKLIALIGRLPGTLQDRSIAVLLQRKLSHETVERFARKYHAELHQLRSKLARWAGNNVDRLTGADPVIPKGLNDRAEDCWRPLIAVADAVGGIGPRPRGGPRLVFLLGARMRIRHHQACCY